jgi:hypothetical protein
MIPAPRKVGPPGPRPLKVYGGVRRDFEVGTEVLKRVAQGEPPPPALDPIARAGAAGYDLGLAAFFLGVDLPLSAVADTLTLRTTIPASLQRQREKQEQETRQDEQSAKPISPP